MENIDVKKIVIAVICILALVIGIFLIVNAVNAGGKQYQLERISEEDCKYFEVYAEGKAGVLNEKGEMIIENIYEEVIIPNPTKPVFICISIVGKPVVLNENKEIIFDKYDNVEAISSNGITTHFPYEKSVLKFEKDGKYRTY